MLATTKNNPYLKELAYETLPGLIFIFPPNIGINSAMK
jgi:hypothetical protein